MTKMPVPEHQPLAKPTVVYTSFTLIFSTDAQFSDVIRILIERMRPQYPNSLRRQLFAQDGVESADPTASVIPDDQAHYRLISEDKKLEVFLGPKFFRFVCKGIYPGWKIYQKNLFEALALAQSAYSFKHFEVITLNYVNRMFYTTSVPDKVLRSWVMPRKSALPDAGKLFSESSSRYYLSDDGFIGVSIAYPRFTTGKKPKKYLELGLSFSETRRDEPMGQYEDIFSWLETAHDNIYSNFVACLSAQYWRSIK